MKHLSIFCTTTLSKENIGLVLIRIAKVKGHFSPFQSSQSTDYRLHHMTSGLCYRSGKVNHGIEVWCACDTPAVGQDDIR